MICITCGEKLDPGHSGIALIEREGQTKFRWVCEHHPVGDAVVFASDACAKQWLYEHHPELVELYEDFVKTDDCCGLNPEDIVD